MISLVGAIGLWGLSFWIAFVAYYGPFKEYKNEKTKAKWGFIYGNGDPRATVTVYDDNGKEKTMPREEFFKIVFETK